VRFDLGCPGWCGREAISIGAGISVELRWRCEAEGCCAGSSGVVSVGEEEELSSERDGLSEGVRKKSVLAVVAGRRGVSVAVSEQSWSRAWGGQGGGGCRG
jgi:hypothetical protein